MLRTRHDLRAKSNANEVNGHPPGTLLIASVRAGGGFVGAPVGLSCWQRTEGWPENLFPRVEFPQESNNYKYDVWQDNGVFYIEEHRVRYGWVLPVTEKQKNGEG